MNRRRFARVRVNLRFTFAWDEHFALFRTLDVGASGALVVRHDADSPLPELGAVGQCAFNLDSAEVRTEAKVVRLVNDGFAVRFEGLPRSLEDRLVAWVFRMEAQALSRRMPA
jgi:c-di-GMP-binding flagellar brake protein YcgR